MVEHLVYTERVGGSSPSPPTNALTRFAAPLAFAAVLAALAFAAPAFGQDGQMRFRMARLEGPLCHRRCPEVIVADGVIEDGTPQAFVDFVKTATVDPGLRAVVFMNSPGGQVVASMKLGAIFRKLKVVGIVGRVAAHGSLEGPIAGSCVSACVYALMGAIRRIVPPQSQVATHRMSAEEKTLAQWVFGGHGARRLADQDMVDALARYAAGMGVSAALVREAESRSPEDVHVLSARELRRWRLETSQS